MKTSHMGCLSLRLDTDQGRKAIKLNVNHRPGTQNSTAIFCVAYSY